MITNWSRLAVLNFCLGVCIYCSSCYQPKLENKNTQQLSAPSDQLSIAKDIHKRSFTIDAHADVVTSKTSPTFLSPDGQSKISLSKLMQGGMSAVVMAVAVPPGPRTKEDDKKAKREAEDQLKSILDLVVEKSDSVVLAKSTSELMQAKLNNELAILVGFQNARSLQGEISLIDSFYHKGVRMFGLTHLGHNDFADSSRPFYDSEKGSYEIESEHGGLSELGEQAVIRMNKLGAILDVSQLSKQATIQAINLSKAPVIASHSNVRAISNVSRNLSDEEIDLIGAKGGVIHVSAFRAYLLDYSDQELVSDIKKVRRAAGVDIEYSYPFELYWEIEDPVKKMDFLLAISELIGPANVDHLIDHIDYIVNRIGIDHVGIGTDFNHGSGIDGYLDASDAFNVTLGLVKRGYSEVDIAKIWGTNFLRVFQEVEEYSKN